MGSEKSSRSAAIPTANFTCAQAIHGVMGSGYWAELPNGRIVGRNIYSGVYLCDLCGREWHPVHAFAVGVAK
jgi:hypothetical protein